MNAVDPKLIRQLAAAELDRRKKLLAMKEDAERDLLSFVRMMWSVLEPATPLVEGWVLETQCDMLMACVDGHIKKAISNVVPGAMKSLLLNVFFPAWVWGPCDMPWTRFISVSYATSLPERDNGRFQRLINSTLYQKCWGDRVKVLKDSVEIVENERTGWKRVLSIGGTTTGWRANYILIDDANNPVNVESDDVRQGTNLWLREVMPSRLNNLVEDVIINIQQRTHMSDATATLAEMWADEGFCWVCIPMELDPLRIGSAVFRWEEDGTPMEVWTDPRSLDENGDQMEGLFVDDKGTLKVRMGSPMAQAEGELCWPERFPPEVIPAMKKIAYVWAGQYQQSPTIRGGGLIRRDWWQPWTSRDYPDFGTCVAYLDTAQEQGKENDYNALTCWGAFPGAQGQPQIMLTHAWKDRLPLAQLVARVAEICFERKIDYLLIEHKTRGRDVHDEIIRLYQNAPWQTVLDKVKDDKTSRLNAVSHLFSGDVRKDPQTNMDVWTGGMVFAPDTQWAEDVIDEVCMIRGTQIVTDRGLVDIAEICPGDEVMTHLGRFRPVLRVSSREARGLVTLSPKTLDPVTMTETHPVLGADIDEQRQPGGARWMLAKDVIGRGYKDVVRGGRIFSEAAQAAHTAMLLPIPVAEMPLSEIDLRDWARVARDHEHELVEGEDDFSTTHAKSASIKWRQPLDHPFGRFLGLYIAEGYAQRHGVTWAFNARKEQHLVVEIQRFLKERISVGSRVSEQNNCSSVTTNLAIVSDFFGDFGKRAHLKCVPRWIWDAPDAFLAGLIAGWVEGDGYKDRGRVIGVTVSKTLAWQMRLLGLRLGIDSSVTVTREAGEMIFNGKPYPTRTAYHLSWRETREAHGATIDLGDKKGFSVMDKTCTDAVAEVFNIEVLEDNSYLTTGGIVHNCAFPRAPHDDYTDSTSGALGWMRKHGVVLRKAEHMDQETESKKYRRPNRVPYAIRRT